MNIYHCKLYAFLRSLEKIDWLGADVRYIYSSLVCLQPYLQQLDAWWLSLGGEAVNISCSSDRVSLAPNTSKVDKSSIMVRHPISGQKQNISTQFDVSKLDIGSIQDEEDMQKVFWWFWRFFPELLARQDSDYALLIPTHRILPDCPLHSYQSTVSALAGAMFRDVTQTRNDSPYLLLFTFSPVQEFIKSSRKFLDFWSGSYLLHYFSAFLCFEIAQMYGADAVITPSLWSQEIIDAFLVKEYPDFKVEYKDGDPASKFSNPLAQSLSTAGFPNVITAVIPSRECAVDLGNKLKDSLNARWLEVSHDVRKQVKQKVINLLQDDADIEKVWSKISEEFPLTHKEQLKKELKQLRQGGCWEWNQLWDAQIQNTWETYFVAIPVGNPKQPLEINTNDINIDKWIDLQNQVAQPNIELPTQAELDSFPLFNVGSWWGSLQGRLGTAIQAIKNTRAWQIPVAPGERSTLSGQYSALHPRFIYQQFKNGFGIASESLRLFWRLMSLAYPGLFNGSEKLNAIELTKRMAWKHGGIAESLGIDMGDSDDDYEGLIRFPNLSSIASAHFAAHHPKKVQAYWQDLEKQVSEKLKPRFHEFCSRTRRPFQVKRADAALKEHTNYGKGYNGAMFSSKWLADDMSLDTHETNILRNVIDTVQKKHFGDNSPADWWVLVLGDGDGMGAYVNGRKLHVYKNYLNTELLDKSEALNELLTATRKRMGPATHVGLNRALLDFSNRLVPYIVEQRFCGRVIYSGGDDVKAALSLPDLPEFLLSLRAAWCGGKDPQDEFENKGGYWKIKAPDKHPDIPSRPLFTMGEGATMSLGIVIAHKSVPLPTVLENLWEAEKERAKKLIGDINDKKLPDKDGLCFRVIYGSGNTLEALMKGHLLEDWWNIIKESQQHEKLDLSPLLYRLAEEIPRHATVTSDYQLFSKVAQVAIHSRSEKIPETLENALLKWLDAWEKWAFAAQESATKRKQGAKALGVQPEDMSMLLKFTAFWISRKT
jgi:CRISPR-associated protein Cmr2